MGISQEKWNTKNILRNLIRKSKKKDSWVSAPGLFFGSRIYYLLVKTDSLVDLLETSSEKFSEVSPLGVGSWAL